MQRYRINYHWLFGVFVSSLVLAVAAYFVWYWQVERKAGYFLRDAEASLAEDEPFEAFRSFHKYVQLRPKEEEARIKMGNAAVEVIKSSEATFEQRGRAFGTLDQTVRTTDDPKLRRELAEILMLFGRPTDAIEHVKDLLAMSPKDSELNAMLVRGLFQATDYKRVKTLAFGLIGYDRKTDTFESEKATLEGEPDVYALLSDVLTRIDKDTDLARRVIDQMVEANPDSPKANLQKSIFLGGLEEYTESMEFLDKAYQLDSKDAAILARKGSVTMGNYYEKAKFKYFETLSRYERVLSKLARKGTASLNEADYKEAKSSYEEALSGYKEALSGYEKAEPNHEEALSLYEEAKSLFKASLSKLEPKGSVGRDDSNYKEAQENFKEIQSKFEELPLPDNEGAKAYFATGLKEHPDKMLFYRLMAGAELRLEKQDAAMKILDEGILKFEKARSIDLVIYKLDLLFGESDFPAIEREIKRLAKLHNRPELQPIIDFQRARILFRKQKWAEAARELKRVRPLLFDRDQFQISAGMMLGASYESQAIFDSARQVYESILSEHPEHKPAQKGLARIDARIRPQKDGVDLDLIVNKTLELPEEEQDWDKVDELLEEVIVEHKLDEARQKLLRAKVLIKRGKFAEAKDLIRQAAKDSKDDIDVHFAAVLLVLSDPEQGAAPAMKLLDNLEKKWGRSLKSLSQRAELLVQLRPEDVSEQLRSLASSEVELTEAEQLRLLKIMGLKFDQLGKYDVAREYYEKAAEQEPNNFPLRMHLFDLAMRQGNNREMEKAQEAVLEFVKSKNDASYILNEVKRIVVGYSRGEVDRSELASSRKLLDTALRQRPEWHELHITYGQILLMLDEEVDLALQHFDEALKYGPARSNAVTVQVKLLAQRGLYSQARERMERLNKKTRSRLLGRLEAEILIKTGDEARGFQVAEQLAESQPENSSLQVWFSKIAQQMSKLDIASASLRTTLKKNSSDPDKWLRLIGLYAEQQKFKEAESVIREAHLSSEAEFLPLLTAKYYELQSRWQSAESIYLSTYGEQTESLSVARTLADFYLLWAKKDAANTGKAAQYINRILKAANDGKAAADNPHVIWARQRAARILFANKDYQQSLKAEHLLRQSTVNNAMSTVESELLVDILITRSDPQSLLQALQLLTELRKSGRLSQKGGMQLARLLSRTHQWDESQELLLTLIADYPDSPAIRTTHVDLLIDQGEYSSAERSLKRLQGLDPKNRSLIQLSARLASEKGNQAGLNRLLTSLLPKLKGAMNEAQLKTVLNIAQLATRFGDNELAEKLYRVYTKRNPDDLYQLTRFLAYHGDCDEAIQQMKRLYSNQTDDVIHLANRMISARRDEFGDQYDEPVDRLIDESLRDDPDSMTRQLARAEAYETQGKNDLSIATYEKLLQRDDLPTRVRAAAMNNLGFQLALLEQRVDEAERLINDAMETFGPVEDMLDTRAVVHIAQEKYDLAIKDMELALSISRDPVKYFHLAKACILAGNGQAALKAWEKAQSLGFTKDALPVLEKPAYQQILQKIESFQTQNAKL